MSEVRLVDPSRSRKCFVQNNSDVMEKFSYGVIGRGICFPCILGRGKGESGGGREEQIVLTSLANYVHQFVCFSLNYIILLDVFSAPTLPQLKFITNWLNDIGITFTTRARPLSIVISLIKVSLSSSYEQEHRFRQCHHITSVRMHMASVTHT